MTPTVALDHVDRTHPGSPPVEALRDVSLAFEAGELAGVVGPSGSGKSTLLNLLGALDRPTSGRVLIDGIDLTTLGDADVSRLRGQHVGFVFQSFLLLDALTALENVMLGLVYQGVARGDRRRRATEALERVGLAARISHRPGALSGGEQQRVAIARAVAGRPNLLLADEPTGNLDSIATADVLALLRTLNEDGTTVVIVTHDLELASCLPRRVTVLDGRVDG